MYLDQFCKQRKCSLYATMFGCGICYFSQIKGQSSQRRLSSYKYCESNLLDEKGLWVHQLEGPAVGELRSY